MVLASAALLVVIGAAFAVLLLSVADLRDSARAAARSQEVLAAANQLELLVVDLETGLRGFVITRQERFLQPWLEARRSLGARAADLERLANGTTEQARVVRAVRRDATSYIDDYGVPLIAAARRGDAAAISVETTAEGKRRIDAMRADFDAFIGTERRIAAARADTSDDAARRAVIAAGSALAVSILLVLAFTGYLARAIVQPVRRAAQMAGLLAAGDLNTRMPATSVGEVGQLESSFNRMAGSLEQNRDELADLVSEQAALRRVATLVARRTDPEEIFSAVAEELAQRLGAELTNVIRYEPDGTATVVGGWGVPGIDIPIGSRLTVEGRGAAAAVFGTNRAARVDRFEGPPGSLAGSFARQGIRSGVGSPIIVEDALWGVAVAGSPRPDAFPAGSEDRMADFTELVATAIANAESRAELSASRARVVAAADETRRRIERDLHDGAQQRLVSLALRLRAAEAAIPPEFGDAHQELARVSTELDAALDELREMSRGIHPAILSEGGLGPAVRTLARRSAVPAEVDIKTDARLPPPVEVTAYYVVSEALTNAARHAEASSVEVVVESVDGFVRVAIRDDGVGGADPQQGSGLVGLRDRVEAIGGTLTVESRAGDGTALLVELPVGGGDSG
jgi:signal transduction histidine kinase